jgi:adenylate cyclase
VVFYCYISAIAFGLLRSDDAAVRASSETVDVARQVGDDLAVSLAETAQAVTMINNETANRDIAVDLLEKTRERTFSQQFTLTVRPIIDAFIAREKARVGDIDEAVELARTTVDELSKAERCIWNALAASSLVEALLQRGGRRDLADAQRAVDWLAAVPTDEGFVLNEITLLRLRALLAQANRDDESYRDYRDRYRKMAIDLGFEGHMAWAEAMP